MVENKKSDLEMYGVEWGVGAFSVAKTLTAIPIPYEQLEANTYRLSSTEEEHIPDDEETETERDFQEEEEFEDEF